MLNKKKLALVRRLVQEDQKKPATEKGTTARDNKAGLKPNSLLRAMDKIGYTDYKMKVRPRGRLNGPEVAQRLAFCEFILRQPDEFFQQYICTDESPFS